MYVIKTFVKLKVVNFFRSGKNLFGQVNSQTLSDQLSCKVSATFVNTEGPDIPMPLDFGSAPTF